MKEKLLALMLATTLAIGLVSCGTSGNATTEEGENPPLRVGIALQYYPFMYLDEAGEPAGFEVDISHAFGDYLGREVEIVNTDFSMLIPALDTGDIDIIISDMAFKEERLEKTDFSDPYRYGRNLALVNLDTANRYGIDNTMSEEDFFAIQGLKFVAHTGTLGAVLPTNYGIQVEEYTEVASAVMEVSQGRADVLIGANTIYGNQRANPDTTVVYEGLSLANYSCFVVKKGDAEMLEAANTFIASMYAEDGFYAAAGDKYDALIGTYLGDDTKGLAEIITPPNGG